MKRSRRVVLTLIESAALATVSKTVEHRVHGHAHGGG